MNAETEIPDSLAAEVGTIPIRNVWLLFLYAYKLTRYEGRFQSEIESSPDPLNFPLLFEKAIAAFFQVELSQRPGWVVRPSHLIQWPWVSQSAGMAGILPSMVCDIVIENSMLGRRVVIDTKFMNILTPGRYGGWRLKSGNIFQVYS